MYLKKFERANCGERRLRVWRKKELVNGSKGSGRTSSSTNKVIYVVKLDLRGHFI